MKIVDIKVVQEERSDFDDVVEITGISGTYRITGQEIEDLLVATDKMCAHCYDTGKVEIEEYDKETGSWMASGKMKKCVCQEDNNEDDDSN